jgi:hypothetical protein
MTDGTTALGMEILLPSQPWLAPLQDSSRTPWSGVVHAYALIATHASNDAVAEQGVEEAMRLLHKCSTSWAPATLQASLVAVHKALFAGNLVPAVKGGECVRLDPKTLERLLGRFQTYLPSLWTLLVAEYSSVGGETLCMLLDSLLALLHVDSMEAVQVCLPASCPHASSLKGIRMCCKAPNPVWVAFLPIGSRHICSALFSAL